MDDPVFGEIEYRIDAWEGSAPFEHGPSGLSDLFVHIRADESGPSEVQRATFEQFEARYAALWPAIAEALLGCRDDMGSVAEVEAAISPEVSCDIEEESTGGFADFELVYTFDLEGEGARGYFVRIEGWEVAEAFVAE